MNPGHNTPNSPCSTPNGLMFTPNSLSMYVLASALPSVYHGEWKMLCGQIALRKAHSPKIRRGVGSNGWFCAGMRETMFAQEIYCANPNPEPNSHSISWVHKILAIQSLWSILEYDIMTVIVIRPLTPPLTCKICSSIFVAMSPLKVVSTTWTSLPSIASS